MRKGLHLLRQRGLQHRALAVHQFVDALGQCGPVDLWQIEVAAQVEQRSLLNYATRAGAVHQTVGDIGLARGSIPGLGAANEHAGDAARKAAFPAT